MIRMRIVFANAFYYVRLGYRASESLHWTLPPCRTLIGSTPIVWEFTMQYGRAPEEIVTR